ncbi:DUF4124 domain-containing protein [Ramlibacter sp. USB13]|uniref:DUF4124 domain-containing protein n=1 Tax=Ramlibacter cellulosilyticus TaxID=2764187 RepID=A0A923MQA1_9BURK|nr:DUF4124 domain-containing protein [Ramlibacter cellulosilyticus]MBC5783500.1 DUF4124 domain-containing protein [Ramlibacter cellulosilyticus]
MNAARLALLALACSLPLAATAQWQWVDKSGRKVYSDQAPPADIPADKILKGPKGMVPAAAAPVATPVVDTATAPAVPKLSGKDKTLEEKKKQLQAADAEKKKAEEAQLAAARAENCARARNAKTTYESGQRIARVDAKGERVYVEDAERAAEIKRLGDLISRDCVQ